MDHAKEVPFLVGGEHKAALSTLLRNSVEEWIRGGSQDTALELFTVQNKTTDGGIPSGIRIAISPQLRRSLFERDVSVAGINLKPNGDLQIETAADSLLRSLTNKPVSIRINSWEMAEKVFPSKRKGLQIRRLLKPDEPPGCVTFVLERKKTKLRVLP